MALDEATAKKILEEMDGLFSEMTEQPHPPMMKMGYGSAMHDLRHVIGDLFPSLKQ